MENPTDNLRIKIALDTMLLSYLVDNTYPSLTIFIKALSENPFVDIVCSRFAVYEFIGIRKLEHYLRCLIDKTKKNGGTANLSSAIKFKNEFDTPELKYIEAYTVVKEAVEKELALIENDFGIIYESVNIHNDLWKPHQDLVLSTRISKEDSLLLLSSVFPDCLKKEDHLVLLTNDKQFYNALCGDKEIETSNTVFKENGLIKPYTYHLKRIALNVGRKFINLIDNTMSEDEVKDFINQFIIEHIMERNKKLFLGKIVTCPVNMQGKLMCFKLMAPELVNEIYVTVLSAKLDNIYNHKQRLEHFYNINRIETYPYIPDDQITTSRNISIEIKDKEEEYLSDADYKKVFENGNLVFIHPDSFI